MAWNRYKNALFLFICIIFIAKMTNSSPLMDFLQNKITGQIVKSYLPVFERPLFLLIHRVKCKILFVSHLKKKSKDYIIIYLFILAFL